jgi:two-component system, LuxR family, sensor histidine kinase DctS
MQDQKIEVQKPTALTWRGSPRSFITKLLTTVIVAIVLSLLGAALWLSRDYESRKISATLQTQIDIEAAAIRGRLKEAEANLELMAIELGSVKPEFSLDTAAQELFKQSPALLRIELRQLDERGVSQETRPPIVASMANNALPAMLANRQLSESNAAMQAAIVAERVNYSRPYYVQIPPDKGAEVFDVAVPLSLLNAKQSMFAKSPATNGLPNSQRLVLVGTYSAPLILREYLGTEFKRSNQVLLLETDGTFIARLPSGPTPHGTFSAKSTVDLPGLSLVIRANSPLEAPALASNLLNAVLLILALALITCSIMLWQISRGRTAAENALANQYAFRAAMENSLVTGLRARDLEGRVTYVNPAFCNMVGYSAAELSGQKPPMPYWAPEGREDYERRYAEVLAGTISREAYETTFMRRNAERFPVLIFEAPLIDHTGKQSGWMSSILDVSEQRKIEETNRLQQETISANARLAMLGEVATALSHELNQPLAAITSYATAAENLLRQQPGTHTAASALEKIRTQADRAGRVIKSVHDFVRYRSVERKAVNMFEMMRRIEPMINLQTRKAGISFHWKCQRTCTVSADGILLEQVILNLTRNAAEAMQTPFEIGSDHVAGIEVIIEATQRDSIDLLDIAVMDRGPGVPPEMKEHLFNAFRSTKSAGMGIGLSFCRSVLEQLGGSIRYENRPGGGSIFLVSLPSNTMKANHEKYAING